MGSVVLSSKLMIHLSPGTAVNLMGHYPVTRHLAELGESTAASSQRSSQECVQASVQPTALLPCSACESWHLVPVLISRQQEG